MGTAYSKKLLVLYILDILQKYTDEELPMKEKLLYSFCLEKTVREGE